MGILKATWGLLRAEYRYARALVRERWGVSLDAFVIYVLVAMAIVGPLAYVAEESGWLAEQSWYCDTRHEC